MVPGMFSISMTHLMSLRPKDHGIEQLGILATGLVWELATSCLPFDTANPGNPPANCKTSFFDIFLVADLSRCFWGYIIVCCNKMGHSDGGKPPQFYSFCGGFSSSPGPFCQRHVRWGFHIWDRPGLSPDQASPEVAGPDTWWKVSWWLSWDISYSYIYIYIYIYLINLHNVGHIQGKPSDAPAKKAYTSQESKAFCFAQSSIQVRWEIFFNPCTHPWFSRENARSPVFSWPWAWGTENADTTGSFWQLLHTFDGCEAMLGFCVVLRVENGGTPHSKRVSWILF